MATTISPGKCDMSVVFIILMLMMGGTFIFIAAIAPFFSKPQKGWKRLLRFVGSFFIVVGAIGFFGSAISSVGGLNWLPNSFEWPIVLADGVIETGNGLYVVPHTPSGRVQLYDSEWKFIRGWHVTAYGGIFKLIPSGENRFEVITSRKHMRYVFDTDGNKLSEASYPPADYDSFPSEGECFFVPTKPWLVVFCPPFVSGAAFLAGMIILGFTDKTNRRKKQTKLSIK
jgi:hypothetical protein